MKQRTCKALLSIAAVCAAAGPPAAAAPQSVTAASAPPAFGVADRTAILTAHGVGAQIYECKADAGGATAWVFREPVAALIQDGKTIGRHFTGPTWELADGDAVEGKTSATAPGANPGDVTWLKLDVAAHHGNGVLKDAKLVLRLNTHGGALRGECPKVGDLRAEPYSADYLFLR